MRYFSNHNLNLFYILLHTASGGKEASKAPKADTTTVAGLDYTDIPHTQIRKVMFSEITFP